MKKSYQNSFKSKLIDQSKKNLFIPCHKTLAWKKLQEHKIKIGKVHLRDLFGNEKESIQRFKDLSLRSGSFFLDYSKNQLNQKTIRLLIKLAQEMYVEEYRKKMFAGSLINWTEERSVLHSLLRDQKSEKFLLNGENIIPKIHNVLSRMGKFANAVRKGKWKGKTGKPITDVVNIGIGGSYLGPKMAVRALHRYGNGPRIHFISNIDGNDIDYVLQELEADTTLFLIASKTFTTEETLANARIAKKWITTKLGEKAVSRHFACMSTNKSAVQEFGIDPTHMFEFWDFVGGRYSIWSAIGLPLMISIGPNQFKEFLSGGYEMDVHFRKTPIERNIPILLALIGIWHNNFLGASSHLIIPYNSDLIYFPSYLQQMDMESNGKRIDRKGKTVNYDTGNILWGEVGTDSQHSFFQLLHQGSPISTIDFIATVQNEHPYGESHDHLFANLMAQSESFAFGLTPEEIREVLFKERSLNYADWNRKQFWAQDRVCKLIPHRVFPGNRSSNTLLIDKLTPNNLGKLIALYEHKVFVQGIVWGINSYDQWGVELGKRTAKSILKMIQRKGGNAHPATAELIKKFQQWRKKNGNNKP